MTTTRFDGLSLYLADLDMEVVVSGTVTDRRGEDPVVDLERVTADNHPLPDELIVSLAQDLQERVLRSCETF